MIFAISNDVDGSWYVQLFVGTPIVVWAVLWGHIVVHELAHAAAAIAAGARVNTVWIGTGPVLFRSTPVPIDWYVRLMPTSGLVSYHAGDRPLGRIGRLAIVAAGPVASVGWLIACIALAPLARRLLSGRDDSLAGPVEWGILLGGIVVLWSLRAADVRLFNAVRGTDLRQFWIVLREDVDQLRAREASERQLRDDHRAWSLAWQGRWDEAVAEVSGPPFHQLNTRGLLLALAGREREALDRFRAASEVAEDQARSPSDRGLAELQLRASLLNEACCLALLGDPDGAERRIRRVEDEPSLAVGVSRARALVDLARSRPHDAVQRLREAPSDRDEHRMLRAYDASLMAAALEASGDVDGASTWRRRAQRLFPRGEVRRRVA